MEQIDRTDVTAAYAGTELIGVRLRAVVTGVVIVLIIPPSADHDSVVISPLGIGHIHRVAELRPRRRVIGRQFRDRGLAPDAALSDEHKGAPGPASCAIVVFGGAGDDYIVLDRNRPAEPLRLLGR